MNAHGSTNHLQRLKLLARIKRRHDTIVHELKIGSLTFSFLQIRDPDRVLDDIVAEADRREKLSGQREHDDDLHLPYWAELWDSAFGIGEWLVANTDKVPVSVLDLGCGMGLVGTVAAALGHRVMHADIEAEALLFARANAMLHSNSVRVRRVDWRRDQLGDAFDLILGADVLYDKSQWEYLDRFWLAHLLEGGSVMLGEPGRQTGELFVNWILPRGWKLEKTEQKISSREKPIRLFRLFR